MGFLGNIGDSKAVSKSLAQLAQLAHMSTGYYTIGH